MEDSKLLKNEMIYVITLSMVLVLRQMTMMIVCPFISTYSQTLTHNTPLLAGLALGVFGLAQAIFQIPFKHC